MKTKIQFSMTCKIYYNKCYPSAEEITNEKNRIEEEKQKLRGISGITGCIGPIGPTGGYRISNISSGGLMQLVNYTSSDVYLTGNTCFYIRISNYMNKKPHTTFVNGITKSHMYKRYNKMSYKKSNMTYRCLN